MPAPDDPQDIAQNEAQEAGTAAETVARPHQPGGDEGDQHGWPLQHVDQCFHSHASSDRSAATAFTPCVNETPRHGPGFCVDAKVAVLIWPRYGLHILASVINRDIWLLCFMTARSVELS